MKQTSTKVWVPKCLVLLLTFLGLSFSQSLFAHSVDGYTSACNVGPHLSIDANVSNVNSGSNYAWQYKNSAGAWVCILNGNNTINGQVYSISGATSTATTNPAPIVFNNPNSGLQGLVIRMVISDGAGVNPCNMPSGNTWNSGSGSTNITINITGTTCATPPDCSCVNSTSNVLINPSFENGSTGWTVSGGTLTTGTGYVMCGAANGFLNQTLATAKMWQDVAVSAGNTITFKGYSGTHTPGISCSPKLSVLYLNSANAVISQTDVAVTKDVDVTGPALTQYTITGTAPVGTVKVRVQASINCNTLKVDAFCLTVTNTTYAAYPDFNVTYVNVPVPGNVSTNDKMPSGTTYGTTPTLISSPAGSSPSITMANTGIYSFVSNLVGVYVYQVPVCAPGQASPCPPTLLTITVLGPTVTNNPPVANTDIATTKMNTAVVLKTLANDKAGNPGGALVPSTVTVTVAAKHGTSSINATTGDNTYTPAAGYVGMDTLTYRVCDNSVPSLCATALQIINIKTTTAANTTLAADDYAFTPINTAVTGNAKTNDTDPEGNTQTITAQTTTVAGKGTLVLAADGSFTFTPVTGFTGPVNYPYTTTDNGSPVATANATIYILVSPELPAMYPDVNVTYVDVHVPGNVNTNDKVPAGTSYGTTPTLISSPAASVATITMATSGVYDFVANKVGVYVYKVPVCVPGQTSGCPTTLLTITVLCATCNNNPPVANTDIASTKMNIPVTLKTLANDKAGNPGGSLVPSSVTVIVASKHGTSSINTTTGDNTYTPAAGFVGLDTLTYRVSDNNGLTATAIQIISVKATTSANSTLAADDYAFTPLNTPVSGNAKTNDTDPEGNTQTITAQNVTVAGKGNLVLNADGTFTFTPFAGFSGPVNFPYMTTDNGTPVATAGATIYIVVSPGAQLPDLTPSIFNDGTTVIQNTTRDNVIRIFNIGAGPTTAPVIFTIPKMEPAFSITVNPNETSMNVFGGTEVSNADWIITEQPSRYVFTSKPGIVISAGGYKDIGLKVTPISIKNSTGNLSVQIVFGTGGGETPFNNNTDNNTYSTN